MCIYIYIYILYIYIYTYNVYIYYIYIYPSLREKKLAILNYPTNQDQDHQSNSWGPNFATAEERAALRGGKRVWVLVTTWKMHQTCLTLQSSGDTKLLSCWWFQPLWKIWSQLGLLFPIYGKTRRRMARERRGAESSVVSMETLYYKIIY